MGESCSKSQREKEEEELRDWARRVKKAGRQRRSVDLHGMNSSVGTTAADRSASAILGGSAQSGALPAPQSEDRKSSLEEFHRQPLPPQHDDPIAIAAKRLAEVHTNSTDLKNRRTQPKHLRPREASQSNHSSSSSQQYTNPLGGAATMRSESDNASNNNNDTNISPRNSSKSTDSSSAKQELLSVATPKQQRRTRGPQEAANYSSQRSHSTTGANIHPSPATICILPSTTNSSSSPPPPRKSTDMQQTVLLLSSSTSSRSGITAPTGGGNGSSRSPGTSLSGSISNLPLAHRSPAGSCSASTSNSAAGSASRELRLNALFDVVLEGAGQDE